ncbi:MAG: SAM-dependent chlorinase/fluorinase, partial [Pyrobaculum sp.]
MKGVIYKINPKAVVVDITHEVPPQDIATGAFVLRAVYKWFPPGT